MRLTNRITCCLCLPNRVFFTLPLRAIYFVIILTTKRMAVQTCYSLLPSKLITRLSNRFSWRLHWQLGTLLTSKNFAACSTFGSDNNKDNNSSSKRLESRKVSYVLERNRMKQKKEKEEKKNKRQKHIGSPSVNQSINHFITKIRSRSSHFVLPKPRKRKTKMHRTRSARSPRKSSTQRRTDPSGAWRSGPTRPCPPRRGRTPSSSRYWRG